MSLASELINWYHNNKRDLPWRQTKDPYKIWLSEIILQQTRVDQGLNYYYAFCLKYPNIKAFAEAPEEEVLRLWQGLGYYSRARNMHFTAKEIVAKHQGIFPSTYSELIKLKGIGPYSAAAIASFSSEEKIPVVDGNVIRVISRIFGITKPVDAADTLKTIKAHVTNLISDQKPSDFNQAIMEFGALFCTPKNPECNNCIFKIHCKAFKTAAVKEIPFKQKKTKTRKRYFYYFVASPVSKPHMFLFKQRVQKDIWQNLYDFPMVESESKINTAKLFFDKSIFELFGNINYSIISVSETYFHKLTHQEIEAIFIEICILSKSFKPHTSMVWISKETIQSYAVPRLIDKFLAKHTL